MCVHDSAQTWGCTLGCVDGRAKGVLNGCAHIRMCVSVQGEGCTRVLEQGFKLAHSCVKARGGQVCKCVLGLVCTCVCACVVV